MNCHNASWLSLVYDREGDCWMVQMVGGTYAVHCGECFETSCFC
ncbi:DUF5348 domain-containing protein [Paenibacillus macerans]